MLGRRLSLHLACAAAALVSVTGVASIGTARAESVLKVALHSDLKIIDPIWTTALISTHHGNMVYDQLFGLDEGYAPHPQMLAGFTTSASGDATATTAPDAVAPAGDATSTAGATAFGKMFARLLERLNLLHDTRNGKQRTLYSLRHTYATLELLAATDIHTLARQMGTSVRMLEAHYSKLTATLAADRLA